MFNSTSSTLLHDLIKDIYFKLLVLYSMQVLPIWLITILKGCIKDIWSIELLLNQID